tara:strand:- start:54 stop:527 length:474 start_codon:yes stop_codon:yes gene_type:complete
MKFFFIVFLSYFIYVFSFTLPIKFIYKTNKKLYRLNLSNNNNNNSSNTNNYLENLNKNNINKNNKNNSLIKKITFDELLLYNNYIDVIYYSDNKNFNKIIIEFKNNTKNVYYIDSGKDNYNVKTILENIKDLETINFNDYPYYIINSPFAFLLCENK